MNPTIRKANIEALDHLVPLFDRYMVFYNKPSAPDKYRRYLQERLDNDEATIFIAYDPAGTAIGFVLNYHSFSSVSLGRIIVLNDLFVDSKSRRKGVGHRLIQRSLQLAQECGAVRVDLGTAKDNNTAQALYEKIGFVKDTEFYAYSFAVR